MSKYYQYFGLALIMVFSFYYTEKISLIVLNKNPLMMTIKEEAKNYNVASVNAVVDGNYVTPGINGLEVNARESFYKMQTLDVFNKYFLVYDEVKPKVSLDDYKNKIIEMGNRRLNKVSLVLESENQISEYLKSKKIKASILVNLDNYEPDNFFEPINNELDGYKSLENNLNLNKENKHICLINENNKENCLKSKNYLVKPKLSLNSYNISEIKNNIINGSIILIEDSANLTDVLLLIKEIKFKNLEFVYLSEIISEKYKD